MYRMEFSEVTSRIFAHWAHGQGLDAREEVLPGFINASSPERLASMSRVAESAAEIVLATVRPQPLGVPAGSYLDVVSEDLAEAFRRRYEQTSDTNGTDPEFFAELMALNYHLDKDGFLGVQDTDLFENHSRIAREFPAYGDTSQTAEQ